jgi:isopenicillin N synthase-like dioxygenase
MSALQTFDLPVQVTGGAADRELARAMITAWRRDGIFQISTAGEHPGTVARALQASRDFFARPFAEKAHLLNDMSYSGYIASGEEITAGEADFSEIFTVCPDIAEGDPRVRGGWPCHGPVPWPDTHYRDSMRAFMAMAGEAGQRLLQLTALGLGLERLDTLAQMTENGWHHMRVLRFPTADSGNRARGIGAHTDYGLLVIAAQDDVGGLYVRPPVDGETRKRNWLPEESSAGMYEHEDPWTFVAPVPEVLTVFPGDILQFMTDGALLSTPHKVRLNTRDRYAIAYFHEPAFDAVARPLFRRDSGESIHYGTHFTNMFMRCYPERATTQRILREQRLRWLHAAERAA